MSTATAFKYHRPFPFCPDEATPPSGTFDYVSLADTGGDNGLAEAMRLWWLAENAELLPQGAVDDVYFQDILTGLSSTWGLRQGDAADGEFTTSGAATLGLLKNGTDTGYIEEPKERVCFSSENFYSEQQRNGDIFLCEASYSTSGGTMTGSAQFTVAFESGEWRLYYRFLMTLTTDTSAFLDVGNPASIASATGSSTFSFAGYTLDVDHYVDGGSITDAAGMDSDFAQYTF